MIIHRVSLTLQEKCFFASREVHTFFQTEPVIGNYALAYAFGLARAPYHVDSVKRERPRYREDLEPLNEAGIYITPATVVGRPRFEVERFNALVDSYWYQMGQNVVLADCIKYKIEKERPPRTNFPQQGRIRSLARGNRFVCYLFSERPWAAPSYIRLGKFMAKTKVVIEAVWSDPPVEDVRGAYIDFHLNPVDLPEALEVRRFDLRNIPPVPLLYHLEVGGLCYRVGEVLLPVGMAFRFPAQGAGGGKRRGRR
ncbi:MAG: type I-D CRISPR-associated protein Cas5/Csc1 [Deltaproteobacteria bacterium]|nr:MAG: type I-D CRISPR-associated protein Cas5/Csc1 [Deltaproteobacteria bacterium]